MKVLEDMNRCYGCAACDNVCPTNAITMVAQSDGFLYPEIDESKCINCGACKRVCPHLKAQYENYKQPKAYAVLASDEIRAKSASGGMFTLLADYVLDQGGFVCGAQFSDDFKSVHHAIISKKEDLDKLRRSKYLQSENGTIWREIKALLQDGKLVLYTGTPCQCAALKSFLGKSYDNLIVVDLICHSTPSPFAWNKFLDELSATMGTSEVQDVNFRYKCLIGWSSTTYVKFANGKEYISRFKDDPFENAFSKQFISRKSCGKCQFARIPRQGDITIGDFWGVTNFDKKLNDKKGTSIILINSDKGQSVLKELKAKNVFKQIAEVPLDKAIVRNSNTYKFPQSHPGRQKFFDALQEGKKFSTALDLSKSEKYDIVLFSIWYAANYGSSLTNFALYKTLEDMGYLCCFAEIPDHLWPESKTHRDHTFVTRRFCYKHFNITRRYANRTDLKGLNDVGKTFLVGSDQIWNYNLCKSAETYYFLDFANNNKRKIAYGTSFGHKKFNGDEKARKTAGFYLSQFNSVSVREDYAVDLCKNEFSVDAKMVLDPVFLCDKKHYLNCIEESQLNKNAPKQKYLVAYILDPTEAKQSAIENVAKRLGLEYVCIPNAQVKDDMRKNWRLEIKENIDVEDWLYYFSNAEMVITDSFHGVCFSLIFEKPFIAIGNKRRGLDRFYSLLGEVNLLDRLVEDANNIIDNQELLNNSIDYTAVNSIFDAARQESMAWLSDALTKEIPADIYTSYDILDRRIDRVKANVGAKIDEVNTECSTLKGQIEKTSSQYAPLKDELNAQSDSIEKLASQYTSLTDEVNSQNEKFESLTAQYNSLKDEVHIQYSNVKMLMKSLAETQDLLREEQELNRNLIESKSYKIGRAITFIPRKIRDCGKKKK